MVRVSSPAKLRPWSELTAQNGDGGGSWVGDEGPEDSCRGSRFSQPCASILGHLLGSAARGFPGPLEGH